MARAMKAPRSRKRSRLHRPPGKYNERSDHTQTRRLPPADRTPRYDRTETRARRPRQCRPHNGAARPFSFPSPYARGCGSRSPRPARNRSTQSWNRAFSPRPKRSACSSPRSRTWRDAFSNRRLSRAPRASPRRILKRRNMIWRPIASQATGCGPCDRAGFPGSFMPLPPARKGAIARGRPRRHMERSGRPTGETRTNRRNERKAP